MSVVGIDAFGFYVPHLFVDMRSLAERRDIAFEKLNKGLGLNKMAVPDVGEDAASFAANALMHLFREQNIDPRTIGRIYLGTESALDASKPTATYAVEVVEEQLSQTYGERCFKNCDVVDMTFACIGAVDALHNSLDWVRNDASRKAIVIASDVSKYELNSTGEYTQGAGAVALLITHSPSILSIDDVWGVATKSEGDFFKPRRSYKKSSLLKEIAQELDLELSEDQVNDVLNRSNSQFWADSNKVVEVFKEEPVFDGQFSNQCYSDRVSEALEHFNSLKNTSFINDWHHIVFHLPYAFHGRRIIFENWFSWIKTSTIYQDLLNEFGKYNEENKKDWLKAVSKSSTYKSFVSTKIAPGELASSDIGNMYTASIFMSLLSMLSHAFDNSLKIDGQTIGLIAYGSGSKSKVFETQIISGWERKISGIKLFETLNNREEIDVDTYENLHNNAVSNRISNQSQISVSHIESIPNKEGLRSYKHI